MSNESPKRMERMLRRWARQRRDGAGAGWKVHPATRGMLQGEVARTFGTGRGKARERSGARGWWWGLAWGGGAVAAAALVLAVWWPRSGGKLAGVRSDDYVAVRTVPEGAVLGGRLADDAVGVGPGVVAERLAPMPSGPPIVEPKDRDALAARLAGNDVSGAALPVVVTAGVAPANRSGLVKEAELDGVAAKASQDRESRLLAERGSGKAMSGSGQGSVPGQAMARADLADGRAVNFLAASGIADATNRDGSSDGYVAKAISPLSGQAGAGQAVRARYLGAADPSVVGGGEELQVAKPQALALRSVLVKGFSETEAGAAGGKQAQTMAQSMTAPAAPAASVASAPALAMPVATAPVDGRELVRLGGRERAQTQIVGGSGAGVEQQDFLRLNAPGAYRRNLQSPPVPAVLNRFQLQRAGEVVTVVDEDGSVYTGQVVAAIEGNRGLGREAAPVAQTTESLLEKRKGAEVKADVQLGTEVLERRYRKEGMGQAGQAGAGERFWFRASGTNRSANELVVFTGEYVPARAGDKVVDEKLASSGLWYSGYTNGAERAKAGEGGGRIRGRAQVGRDDIQVEALQKR